MSLVNSVTISDFYMWVRVPFPIVIKSHLYAANQDSLILRVRVCNETQEGAMGGAVVPPLCRWYQLHE